MGVLQLASLAVPDRSAMAAAGRAAQDARFIRTDMPENLDGWSLVQYELTEREPEADLGHFSNKWQLRRGTLECLVSIDYPFFGWHDLTVCYNGSGWGLLDRRDLDAAGAGQTDGAYVEAELSKPTGEYGWLLFGLFDQTGEHVVPPASGVHLPRLVDKVARSPLAGWMLGHGYKGDTSTTFQVQVFASSAVGLSPQQRNEIRQLFLAVRTRAIDAYKRKSGERGAGSGERL